MSGDVRPDVSVILVNYNGRPWLPGCLAALRAQQGIRHEVVFVDNGSTDGSLAYVAGAFPEVCRVALPTNEGFAGGNVRGLAEARGEYLLLLNTDTIPSPTLLADLRRAFTEIPRLGCVQPMLESLYDPTTLDACGSYFTVSGFLKHIGHRAPAGVSAYQTPFPVFSVKGAAMMFRRSLLEETGGLFDPKYWCYFEDSDFCLRVWLAGYECWYYPPARTRHATGGTAGFQIPNPTVQYHAWKNRYLTYGKCFSRRTLLRVLPLHLAGGFLTSFALLLGGQPRNAAAFPRALAYVVSALPELRRARRRVQQSVRRISDGAFLPRVTRPLSATHALRQLVHHVLYEWRKPKTLETARPWRIYV